MRLVVFPISLFSLRLDIQAYHGHCDKCDLHNAQDNKQHVLFICPFMEICYLRRKFAEQFADFTGADRIHIGDTEAFNFDNISAEDVKLFL